MEELREREWGTSDREALEDTTNTIRSEVGSSLTDFLQTHYMILTAFVFPDVDSLLPMCVSELILLMWTLEEENMVFSGCNYSMGQMKANHRLLPVQPRCVELAFGTRDLLGNVVYLDKTDRIELAQLPQVSFIPGVETNIQFKVETLQGDRDHEVTSVSWSIPKDVFMQLLATVTE